MEGFAAAFKFSFSSIKLQPVDWPSGFCFVLFLSVRVFRPPVCMCTACVLGAFRGQEWVSDPLEVELTDGH